MDIQIPREYLQYMRDYFIIISFLTGFPTFLIISKYLIPRLRYFIHPSKIDADSKTLATKINSSLHAIICFTYNLLYLLNYIDYTTWVKFIGYTMGYTIFDSFLMISDNRLKPKNLQYIWNNKYIREMVFHHILMYLILNYSYINHSVPMAQSLLCEISSPFLHITWLCIKTSPQSTQIKKIMKMGGMMTVVIFFFTRVLNFTYIYLSYVIYQNVSILVHIISFIGISMNYMWFYKIFNKMISERNNVVKKTEETADKVN